MEITEILDEMHTLFADYPPTELQYETPFQLLVAVILSAQTTDVQVNKVTDTLFQTIKTPQDVLDMGEEEFNQRISSIGLHNSKAKNIVKTSTLLVEMTNEYEAEATGSEEDGKKGDPSTSSQSCEIAQGDKTGKGSNVIQNDEDRYASAAEVYDRFGYVIPDKLAEMKKLPGVGLKTAKVVLYVLYGQPRVAADTHVHRVMNRLGVVDTKSPNATSKQLETIIPDTYKSLAHHVIIYFGRYLCKAKKPECWRCPLVEVCQYKEKNLEAPEKINN